jgi:hypothetical protein
MQNTTYNTQHAASMQKRANTKTTVRFSKRAGLNEQEEHQRRQPTTHRMPPRSIKGRAASEPHVWNTSRTRSSPLVPPPSGPAGGSDCTNASKRRWQVQAQVRERMQVRVRVQMQMQMQVQERVHVQVQAQVQVRLRAHGRK